MALAAGLACLVVGIILVPLAWRLRLPFAAVGFAAVVALIPGVYTFRMASGLLELRAHVGDLSSLTVATLVDAVNAILIVLAMTSGLALPKRFYHMFWSRHVTQP